MNIKMYDSELNIGVRAYSTAVQKLVSSCRLFQLITAPTKTVIVLNDVVPVYKRPRRLAPQKKRTVVE